MQATRPETPGSPRERPCRGGASGRGCRQARRAHQGIVAEEGLERGAASVALERLDGDAAALGRVAGEGGHEGILEGVAALLTVKEVEHGVLLLPLAIGLLVTGKLVEERVQVVPPVGHRAVCRHVRHKCCKGVAGLMDRHQTGCHPHA